MTQSEIPLPEQFMRSDHDCIYCKEKIDTKSCKGCNTVYYFLIGCQKRHWSKHKLLCQLIHCLERKLNQNTKNVPSVETLRGNVYELSPKGKSKIARLVGEQCLVSVSMDGRKYEVLWDTGAQVSLMGKQWVGEYFPEKRLRPISELFDKGLSVKSASGDTVDSRYLDPSYLDPITYVELISKSRYFPYVFIVFQLRICRTTFMLTLRLSRPSFLVPEYIFHSFYYRVSRTWTMTKEKKCKMRRRRSLS